MYLWRRGGRYWFRKAVPIDLAGILGRAEVRCSLATSERAVAQKRALAMQVALEQVYEVLRSDRPLEPAKRLLGTFLEDFRVNGAGSDVSLHGASGGLRNAAAALGDPAQQIPAGGDQTLVPVDDIGAIFRGERPRGEANQTAAELLQLAIAIRREKSWSRPERAKALVRLCQKLVAVSEDKPFGSPQGLSMLGAADNEPHTYLEIAEALRQQGASPNDDLKELWRRIVFNVLISNTDDHLRNHAFLYESQKGWRLSPAYDMNPVPVDVNAAQPGADGFDNARL